ncbi:Protein kinase domain [Popillia japonica]|uniref:Protein kinase domain n=1 Tax=Popillia japonica TaxID=7064 RepID=A0AAW1MB92_POPJA
MQYRFLEENSKTIWTMIKVDEDDPVGEIELSFPYRDVTIKRGVDPREIYELESEIGRGKFGTVYRCREKSTNLELAAKFVGVPKKEDRRNVEREVDIMRQLQHPRLIQLYDAFENGKVMCVILELIEGGELFERVIDDDFVLTEKACTVFMRQICEGVEFIHKQNILHLDMKPENILCLTKTGNRIKIIDFGLARKYDPGKKLQVLFGTPEFVAPEVVNFDQIGFGTDMWSVGVICYVLLSGLSPFMGHTDIETMANVTVAKYDFDDEAFDEISENAKDFIRKLLLKDQDQRMSAEQCLKHVWLRRSERKIPRHPSMDMTKDNLRQFVERWNDHPNSPYVFETASHAILPCIGSGLRLSESLNSLVAQSPSPCESLASSPGSDNAFLNSDYMNGHISMPDHFRRASDSTCVVKTADITERMNLAEEIRRLSDKLFQLSNMSTSLINNDPVFFGNDPETAAKPPVSHSKAKLSHEVQNNTSIPGENKNSLPTDHPESSNCKVPWRKTKNRINMMSRDVPMMPRRSSNSFREQFNSRLSTFNEMCAPNRKQSDDNPNNTKDLLLQLLDHWDGPKGPKLRHASISSEFSDSDSLGQRTISSLNTFFQSRQTSKFTSSKKT